MSSLYLLLGLALLNNVALIILPSYFGYVSSESLSFYVNDGWCNSGEGIRSHCFGDFYYNFNFSNLDAPWGSAPNPYPPLSVFIFKVFQIVFESSAPKLLALSIYLLLSFFSMLFPGFHLLKKRIISRRVFLVLSTIILMSAPMIVSFDRGNLQMLMTPFIYLCIYYFIKNDNQRFIASGCLLVALKPQYILLGILFIPKRDYMNLIKWIISSIFLFFFTFLLYPVNLSQNIKDYFDQIISFNHYVPMGNLYPANLSLNSTLSLLFRFFSVNSPENIERVNSFFIPTWVTVMIFVIVVYSFWKAGPNANNFILIYIGLCLPLLLPGVVFTYHASVLVVFFVFLVISFLYDRSQDTSEESFAGIFLQTKFNWFLSVFIASLLFIPWSIPWKLFPYYKNLPDGNISVSWTLFQLAILILFLKFTGGFLSTRKGRRCSI